MSYRLYPRLSPSDARELRVAWMSGPPAAEFDEAQLARCLIAAGSFPATGGIRMTEAGLLELRTVCLQELDRPSRNAGSASGHFDLAIGRALFADGARPKGEFGVPGVWDFLALVLLPDVVSRRLRAPGYATAASGESHRRLTGGDRRHVLQRLWRRWVVFGPGLVESGQLTEDDYVALLERRLTLEQPEVARRVAVAVLHSGHTGSARREYMRIFMRRLVQVSGLVHIGADDLDHLDSVIEHVGIEATGLMS